MAFTGVVEAPTVIPARFGLLSAATVIEHGEGDEHWILGFNFETEACNFRATYRDICTISEEGELFVRADGPRSFRAYPFSINAVDECSTFGFEAIDRKARVLRQLELVTPKGVERELWTGSFGDALGQTDNRYLASGSATVLNGGTAVSADTGVALLESYIADEGPGYQGVIHMSRMTASKASGVYRQSPDDPNVLETMLGTKVAAGVGYPGTGPNGAAVTGGLRWMYITGPVVVHLGAKQIVNPMLPHAVDPHINDLTYQAERPAVVTWDGCVHAAVLVDVNL